MTLTCPRRKENHSCWTARCLPKASSTPTSLSPGTCRRLGTASPTPLSNYTGILLWSLGKALRNGTTPACLASIRWVQPPIGLLCLRYRWTTKAPSTVRAVSGSRIQTFHGTDWPTKEPMGQASRSSQWVSLSYRALLQTHMHETFTYKMLKNMKNEILLRKQWSFCTLKLTLNEHTYAQI